MKPLRTALHKEIAANVEFGEALSTMLKRKADRQLELIASAQNEQVGELWRAMLDMHDVQAKLVRERLLKA